MNKEEILKVEWVHLGRWIQPPISGCFWTYWADADNSREIIAAFEPHQMLFLSGNTLAQKKDTEALYRVIETEYDAGTLERFTAQLEKKAQEAEAGLDKVKEISSMSDSEFVHELFRAYGNMLTIWTYEYLLALEAERFVKDRKLAANDSEVLARVVPFMRATWLEQQSQDVRELAELVQTLGISSLALKDIEIYSELKDRFQKHMDRFTWLGTHHWIGEPYSTEKLIKDINDELLQERNAVSTGSNVSPDRNPIWALIADCMYWRTHSAEATAKMVFDARKRLSKIAEKFGITYSDFVYLSPREVQSCAEAGRFIRPENFEERKVAYGCYLEDSGEIIVTGESLKEIENNVLPKKKQIYKEVRGVVASRGGIVRGTARVILEPAEFSRMQKGDILIAPETTPDFVPCMKMASAIVTEVGGITSHAAIVSRELRKPCIIGTKIATSVFKDGDFVEVDATSGIVRIAEII